MQLISTNQLEIKESLQKIPIFEKFPTSAMVEMMEEIYLKRFTNGEAIFWEDEPGAGLHIVERGRVRLSKTSVSGRVLILKILLPGSTFNEASVFDGGSNPVSAMALDESDVWVISSPALRQTIRRHPELAEAFLVRLSRAVREMVTKVEETAFLSVNHRMARLIEELFNQPASGAAHNYTQEELAALLGTVREVAARALRDLARSGAIQNRRRQISITNPELLHCWARGITPDEK